MMSEKLVYCENCKKKVAFTVIEKQMEGSVRRKPSPYIGKEAHCEICDSVLEVKSLKDFNAKAFDTTYREKNGIISLEMLLTLTKKYGIGKRPLSRLLGWGDSTYSWYCDGRIPPKRYSDILVRLYEDTEYYAEILVTNKDRMVNDSSYLRSKKVIETLLGIEEKKKRKMDFVAEYFLYQCGDITPLALQKALYYTQGFYYAFYRKHLFEEDCEAWEHGPVYRDNFIRYSDYRFDKIKENNEITCYVLSSKEKAIVESVIKNLCCYSGKILVQFTCLESPWVKTKGELGKDSATDRIISKEEIGKYFHAVKEKYNMVTPADIRAYARILFQQIQ